jgi:general secretion pathway protein A
MKRQPFQVHPPIDGLFVHDAFSQAKARLDYFVNQMSEVALVIADEGMGKSTLSRHFLHEIPQQTCHPISMTFTRLSSLSFLRLLVSNLGESPRQQKDALIQQITKKTTALGSTTLIIIDDAHLLCDEILLDLKLLLSLNQEQLRIKLIFIANNSIKKRLKEHQHMSLSGRCSMLCTLPVFDDALTRQYIDYQINFSGCSNALFDQSIKNEIHQYAHGNLRLMNHLSANCLISAAIKKAPLIDQAILRQALKECPLFI